MSLSVYQEKVGWLFNQFPVFQKIGNEAFKPTLENTLALVKFLQVPVEEMNFVHVAGTNGKGTTCSIIASAFTESGKKTGLFTSPHIKDFRERMRINGQMISEEKVVEYVNKFQGLTFDFSPSFFEMTWAMALAFFYENKCDIVVVETGLGGRLDATNIIRPQLSVITNIGLDHVAILGNTRAAIAKEKAGIIKEGVPVLIGESDAEIEEVFLTTSKEKKAPIVILEQNDEENTFQKNKKLAFKAIDMLLGGENIDISILKEKALANLFQNTGLYGRNQIISKSPLIIADAAHNVMGVERFIKMIQKEYEGKRIKALYGASNDKDLTEIVHLFPTNWEYYITEFNSPRTTKVEDFKKNENLIELNTYFFSNSKKAYESIQHAANKDVVIVVFGSFFLLEEIF